jgi:hypothetical protein
VQLVHVRIGLDLIDVIENRITHSE